MEDFDCLDQLLNSPSSLDNDLKQRMTWPCQNEDQNQNSYSSTMVLSGFELAQDTPSDFLVSDLDPTMGLNPCQDRGLRCQFDTSGFVPSSSLDTYPPGMGNSQFGFPSFQNVPQLSHVPSFDGISSISHPGLSQNGSGGFGFEGQYIDHSSNFPTSLSLEDLQSYPLPASMTSKSNGLQSSAITQPGECDSKIGKPRPRARRGQATDPHSISERIRREKIADRMKNLQELLPNLIKTDKASSLDEIIEYVKFLQVQVKVLSTSRAGKVVSRTTDSQAEGVEGFLVPPSSGQLKSSEAAFDWDEIAFERELVKLMDSNVSEAMEFLQTKGLSLMPVSLASAISPLGGVHTEASNGNEANLAVKPDQSENKIPLRATESRPKSSPNSGFIG